jgi:hypothetical protein
MHEGRKKSVGDTSRRRSWKSSPVFSPNHCSNMAWKPSFQLGLVSCLCRKEGEGEKRGREVEGSALLFLIYWVSLNH